MSKGLMLDQNKINVLCIDNMSKEAFESFIKNIPYRNILSIKDRKSLVDTLSKIEIGHIKEGVLLLCDKNYRLDTINFNLSSYLNKVYIRQHIGMRNNFSDTFVVNNNNSRMNISYDVILNDLKVKSRLFKVKKLKEKNIKRINVDYAINIGDIEKNFSFYITEDDTKMTWEEFNKLDEESKHNIIRHFYDIDLASKVKHNIVNVSANF